MKKAHAELLAKVMLAYVEGKTIERYHNGKWYEDPDPDFDCGMQWRVKPEPRTIWVDRVYLESAESVFGTRKNMDSDPGNYIKFQEVI